LSCVCYDSASADKENEKGKEIGHDDGDGDDVDDVPWWNTNLWLSPAHVGWHGLKWKAVVSSGANPSSNGNAAAASASSRSNAAAASASSRSNSDSNAAASSESKRLVVTAHKQQQQTDKVEQQAMQMFLKRNDLQVMMPASNMKFYATFMKDPDAFWLGSSSEHSENLDKAKTSNNRRK